MPVEKGHNPPARIDGRGLVVGGMREVAHNPQDHETHSIFSDLILPMNENFDWSNHGGVQYGKAIRKLIGSNLLLKQIGEWRAIGA